MNKTSIRDIIDYIKYPIITDKTTKNLENNEYTFLVDKRANKTAVKKIVEYIFDVEVAKINILNMPPKKRNVGKFTGKISQHKKAIIKLKNNFTIDLFENK
uniref:Large ribosomal subunit protein uL23c n=1 Tax=Spyridia filamentosa TaxID=196632 RepID=A0A1Z1MJJ3_SPYFI|nr:ribosomal protein L23 [Spyridia filamentosa]ARW66250.1 ribosomal protein L23 [Spyridia filamentosa]